MASNLSSVGFAFANAEEFQKKMIELAADAVERVDCVAGDYSIWRSRTGAEIWFHLPMLGTEDNAQDIAGLTPFYEGKSEVAVEVTTREKRPDDNDFEGALTAQAISPEGGEHAYPLTFDAVDFSAHADRTLPFKATARIVGFARALRAFANDEDFATEGGSSDGAGIGLAPRAFIPLGQFAELEDCDSRAPPESTALLTGRVLEHRRLTNEATGADFHWLLVESFAATYDVVADPEIVTGEIVAGGTVEVGCVLIGRLVE